ncbi:Hypothetical predicted protein, partial [Mytilus galloprovincialis]
GTTFHPARSGVRTYGQRIYRIPCSTCEADPQQTEKWIRGEPEILAETGETSCLIMELPFRPEIHHIWTTAYVSFVGKLLTTPFHFEQCIAKTSFCYKCRSFGHYARMCNFHRQPDVKVVKVKSKSKLRRDAERMKIFKEQKAMSIFPCAQLNTIELMDFFPTLNYDREFIDNVRLRHDRVNSGRVKFEIKSVHYA